MEVRGGLGIPTDMEQKLEDAEIEVLEPALTGAEKLLYRLFMELPDYDQKLLRYYVLLGMAKTEVTPEDIKAARELYDFSLTIPYELLQSDAQKVNEIVGGF
jgi:hypothetical protein